MTFFFGSVSFLVMQKRNEQDYARVADPLLYSLWIANPQGQRIRKSTGTCVVFVNILPAFSKKACRKLKMFSVKNEPRSSERSEGVWRV